MRAHQSQRKGDMARSNPDRAPTGAPYHAGGMRGRSASPLQGV